MFLFLFSASTAPQSSVEYSFIGAAISLYGPIGPKGAPFSVQVDEQPFQNLTSIYPVRFIPQSLLYHIGGLGDGLHTIKIVHDGKSLSGQVLGIDYFNMFLTPGIDARYVIGDDYICFFFMLAILNAFPFLLPRIFFF